MKRKVTPVCHDDFDSMPVGEILRLVAQQVIPVSENGELAAQANELRDRVKAALASHYGESANGITVTIVPDPIAYLESPSSTASKSAPTPRRKAPNGPANRH